jgi:hypothetical protein
MLPRREGPGPPGPTRPAKPRAAEPRKIKLDEPRDEQPDVRPQEQPGLTGYMDLTALACRPAEDIMVFSDSGASTSTFGVQARHHFLVPGTLKKERGKFCHTAGGRVRLTHTGTAAACLVRNDDTRVYIIETNATFSDNMTDGIALWSETCLVKMGFSIYREPGIGCWISKHGYIPIDDRKAIVLNTKRRPGSFILETAHGEGLSPAENLTNFFASTKSEERKGKMTPRNYAQHKKPCATRERRPELGDAHQKRKDYENQEDSMERSEVAICDENGRRFEDYSPSERSNLAKGNPYASGPTIYVNRTKTDISLVELTKFPYANDVTKNQRPSQVEMINLWQARLGFPHPDLLAKILKGTTGHNIDPEKARSLARRTLITTLANQERSQHARPANHNPTTDPISTTENHGALTRKNTPNPQKGFATQ